MNYSNQVQPKTIVKAILLLGLLVGTLDILSAIIDYYITTGKGPAGIFKYIASAIIGKEAFAGGAGTVVLGLLLHYLIAFLFTIFFVYLYITTNLPNRNKLVAGILYGVLIWATMNLIVVPLSLTPKSPSVPWKMVKAAIILICMIGLPLAFFTGRSLHNTAEG